MMIIDSELYCHDHQNCSPQTFLLSSKEEVPFGRNEAHCLDRTYSNHQQHQPRNFSWKQQENNERKNNLSLSLPSHHTFMSLHRTFDIPSRDHWVGRQTLQTEDSTEVHNFIGAGLKRKNRSIWLKGASKTPLLWLWNSWLLPVFPQLFKFSFVFPQLASIFQMDWSQM